MKNVLSVAEIREAEAKSLASVGENQLRMMAALAVADGIYDRAKNKHVKTAVFCGVGGNGHDGLLAAVMLYKKSVNVALYLVGEIEKFDKSALALCDGVGLKVAPASEYGGDADILIDAIFGIGLNRAVSGEVAELIDRLNAEDGFKLAVDIPSGLNADSGEIMGTAFRADITMSFSCYKTGMLFGQGRDVCGRIVVENIGINTESDVRVYENSDFKPYKRKKSAHKGSVGRIYVIGGCGEMVGAPMLAGAAAHAAHLNGAGTVTVCLPTVHRAAMSARATMSMMKFLPDTPDGFIKFDKTALDEICSKATAIDIGMGMGKTPELKAMLEYLCDNFDGTLVIDADALNAVAKDYAFLREAKCSIVITPHVGEFERLTGRPADIENAKALARDINCIVALKSATTIITDGNEVRLNVAGTPALAKGGMGDVLGGCITALACSFNAFDAATIACYRNGVGAERAVSSYSEMMLTPKELLKFADYDEM